MGIPVIEAPCEAEAQCAVMVQQGKVWGAGSEDMDTLTLGTPLLLRHLTFSPARKMPVMEIHMDKVLEGFGITMDSFIDLCILLGCDYCEKIRGIGPKTALSLIRKWGDIDTILKKIDKQKYKVPEYYPFEQIREYFRKPEVDEECKVSWDECDEEAILKFMCEKNGFSEDRIKSGIARLKKTRKSSTQGRITSFFAAKPSPKKNNKGFKKRTASNLGNSPRATKRFKKK
mmetsp:Transcript_7728/g.8505  ORF Transcript_7728/g.8505 Transcript_7728/m.8505 type:complete len:230 (-) Transcript_7728:1314-2003(-)|eukprot:CAMPEP_0168519954 /NCGR_PEP_ID=MMETSP0405-20121227/7646_1 /TAXON_ID=498012 /ORGANISM="Trichosphaerium sp, Strain Am-I-7 wt" /LENGTH=229 /DNA_ID=CAMNT_0008540637 /DNA_START=393 /DNA_END=1082 /DNA_ORIENTATION=+